MTTTIGDSWWRKLVKRISPALYHEWYCSNDVEMVFPVVAKTDPNPAHRYPVKCLKCGHIQMLSPLVIRGACFFRDQDEFDKRLGVGDDDERTELGSNWRESRRDLGRTP